MGWFSADKTAPPPQFRSRAEAFAYMLSHRMSQGCDAMEAAREAGEFADIYATNMALPTHTAPPAEGLDKYLRDIDKITAYCDQHPKMVDLLLGAVSFVGGVLTAKKLDNQPAAPPPPPKPPIDFDSVE